MSCENLLLHYKNDPFEPKPILRGVLHLITAISLPQLTLWVLSKNKNITRHQYYFLFKFFIISQLQVVFSSLLHIFEFDSPTSDYIQKLDHIMIHLNGYELANILQLYGADKKITSI